MDRQGSNRSSLERFSSFRGVSGVVRGGFYFHPRDKDPSLGTPERKNPLSRCGFALHQLENRYNRAIAAHLPGADAEDWEADAGLVTQPENRSSVPASGGLTQAAASSPRPDPAGREP
ncbi:MAG: hypothetical protein WBM14_05795, partial [Terracidiphilus sp.]